MMGISPSGSQASPGNLTSGSPGGPFEVGANGPGMAKTAKRGNTTLSVDVEPSHSDMTDMTASTTTSGPGKKKGNAKKPAKGKKGQNATSLQSKEDFVVPSTPTGPGQAGQGHELHYDPSAHLQRQQPEGMVRSDTLESLSQASVNGDPAGVQVQRTPDEAMQQAQQVQQQQRAQHEANAGQVGPNGQAGTSDDILNYLQGSMGNPSGGGDVNGMDLPSGATGNENVLFDDFDFSEVG